ncbi:MAG: SRPBCC family protein [Gemmatimonadales bacterium]
MPQVQTNDQLAATRPRVGADISYRLDRRQVVGGTVADVFGFFKSPDNLEAITPPWLGFRVMRASDPEVREGTRVGYRLRLHGVPFRWESRITEYRENVMFADEQLVGPYRRWYHQHLFHPVPGGIAIEDVVEYQLPLGVVGRLAHAALVRGQLERIFDHRARVIAERFPLRPALGGHAELT